MTDPLAEFWVHEVVIDRYTGPGSYVGEDAFTEGTAGEPAYVSDGLKVMATSTGDQIISTARVGMPASTPPIPINSRMTLPPEFGSRVCTVVAVAVGNGGGLPTPDHIEVTLK